MWFAVVYGLQLYLYEVHKEEIPLGINAMTLVAVFAPPPKKEV